MKTSVEMISKAQRIRMFLRKLVYSDNAMFDSITSTVRNLMDSIGISYMESSIDYDYYKMRLKIQSSTGKKLPDFSHRASFYYPYIERALSETLAMHFNDIKMRYHSGYDTVKDLGVSLEDLLEINKLMIVEVHALPGNELVIEF
jgi:hypothetical protein